MNYTLITGASSGIGYELAVQFAKNGHDLVLVSKDHDKVNRVSEHLENTYKIKSIVIPLDLSLPDAAEEIFRQIREKSMEIEYLVNNAGFLVEGDLTETSWADEQALVQLQCVTHTRMIKFFLPGMLKRGRGGILNVCSNGSFVPGPGLAVYCAAKSFVLSLSRALAEEVSGSGVTVTALCPGKTRTNFRDFSSEGNSFLFPIMEASVVAEKGYKALMKGRKIVVPGLVNRINVFVSRFVPLNLMTRISGRIAKNHL